MGTLADLAARTAFPGRVRQFADPDPAVALALAIGCAWAERPRRGYAAAVVPAARRGDPAIRAGYDLAAALCLPNLIVLDHAEADVACEDLGPRERQPVRLASLGRDLVPRWTAATPGEALGDTAACEPLLLLPGRDASWRAGPAALLALAWIATEGRRVVWELPRGTDLAAWEGVCAAIGRLQAAITLVIQPDDLPWAALGGGLRRWWVAAPGPADAAGALAWALASEHPTVLALPERFAGRDAWLPGAPRRLAAGAAGTVLCAARDATAACALAAARGCGVLQLDGLLPLPLAAMRRAPDPLIVVGEDLARHLAPLATLDPRLRCTLAPPIDATH